MFPANSFHAVSRYTDTPLWRFLVSLRANVRQVALFELFKHCGTDRYFSTLGRFCVSCTGGYNCQKGTTVPGILRRSSELLCRLRTVGGVGLRRSSPWLVATAINTTLATTVAVWGSTNNEVSNHHGTGE